MTSAQKTEIAYRMNLAGFEKLIQQCEALGKAYKPSAAKLKLTALNKQKNQVVEALKESREHAKTYLKEYSERSTFDRNMRQITREIMKAFPRPDPPFSRDEMKKMSREEWEKREKPKPDPLFEEIRRLQYAPGVRNRSAETVGATVDEQPRITHREWYTQQATTLAGIAEQVKALESYTPENDAVKPEALLALAHDMQQKNEALDEAAKAKKQADEKLYAAFYDPDKGLVATANAVKEYIAVEADPEIEPARIAAVIMFKNDN